jgi:hypothetical protein
MPEFFPKFVMPECFPKFVMPECFPKFVMPECFPKFVMPECFPKFVMPEFSYRASMISASYNLYSRSAHPEPVEGRGNDRIGSFAINSNFLLFINPTPVTRHSSLFTCHCSQYLSLQYPRYGFAD